MAPTEPAEPSAPDPADRDTTAADDRVRPEPAEPAEPIDATPSTAGDRAERVVRAALLFRLTQPQADAFDAALAIHDSDAVDPADPEELAALAGHLTDAEVADAFANDTLGQDPARAVRLAGLASRVREATAALTSTRAHAAARAAAAWLLAECLHVQQRVEEVTPLVDEALAADADYRPALELASRYASDAGDAARAVELARRGGVDADDEWLQMLSSMIPRARPDVGRNDPCPCGSGRKYKQCHLGRETLELDERAYWLWRKATDHLQDSPWQHRLVEVGNAMLRVGETTYDSMTFAMTDPLVADLVLFADDAWQDFVAVRGPLLPADELELAHRWEGSTRRLYEVRAFEAGTSVTVRDLRTDGLVTVRERSYSRTAQLGDVIYARIAPAGPTEQFFGGLQPVLTDAHRDELADLLTTGPDALALARLIGAWREPGDASDQSETRDPSDAAPARTATTSEGEPVVFVTSTWQVPDDEAAMAALDGRPELRREHDPAKAPPITTAAPVDAPSAFADAGGDPPLAVWVEEISRGGQQWLRGSLTLRPGSLSIRANAEARHERLVALVTETVGELASAGVERLPYEPRG
jgi:hypothetical protein